MPDAAAPAHSNVANAVQIASLQQQPWVNVAEWLRSAEHSLANPSSLKGAVPGPPRGGPGTDGAPPPVPTAIGLPAWHGVPNSGKIDWKRQELKTHRRVVFIFSTPKTFKAGVVRTRVLNNTSHNGFPSHYRFTINHKNIMNNIPGEADTPGCNLWLQTPHVHFPS